MSQLKIMSFNIRTDVPSDGINSFTNRFDRVIDVILKESPDFIGFQEVTDSMRARLRNSIPGYSTISCGRGSDCHGESMLVAYRTDDAEVIGVENIWLSLTPTIPGSTYGGDQSHCPRMFTSVLFKHKSSATPIRFINTHLDHQGKDARYLGSVQLVQYISSHSENFVLTGDFNARHDAREIKVITDALAYRKVIDCTADIGGTFHWFGKYSEEESVKIDYIFTDLPCANAYAVPDIPVNGQYYSDHKAICAIIDLT